jgi:hypothetical protein
MTGPRPSCSLFSGAVVLVLMVLGSGTAKAGPIGFQGDYAPPLWTIEAPNGGSVDTSGAPDSVMLIGPNNGGGGGNLNFWITVFFPGSWSGAWSFNWEYWSDDYGNWDQGYYVLNGTQTLLAQNGPTGEPSPGAHTHYFGKVLVPVSTGDRIEFRIHSNDGTTGPGYLRITNFDVSVPEPATFGLLGLGCLVLAARFRRRTV